MPRPNLSGTIQKKDVHEKGGGKFKAKYMAWAKIAQLLNDKAPEWTYCLETDGGNPVWKAPNGTGYLQGYFRNDDGTCTSLFPFSIMNNMNQAIKYEAIGAREITDSHRRSLCAASAFFFSLGFELWADEEISDEKIDIVPECQLKQPAKPSKDETIEKIMVLLNSKKKDDEAKQWVAEKAKLYNVTGSGSKLKQMSDVHLQEMLRELNNA